VLEEKITLTRNANDYCKILNVSYRKLNLTCKTSTNKAIKEFIEDRYNSKSTIVSSQIPVSTWYDTIGEGTIADAILDRLVNSSHRINLKGESLRKNIMRENK